MRIAQVAPLYEAVPPSGYGGTERVVSWLCDELVALGHDVTLFAAKGSASWAHLVHCRDQPFRTDPMLGSDLADHALALSRLRDRVDEFDIIHFHLDILPMLLFEECAEKTVTTLHGRLDIKGLSDFLTYYDMFPLVSISNHQRLAIPHANYAGTIYHGMPEQIYVPHYGGDQDYVAFIGRFSPEKGAEKAIDIARRAGCPIRLAAKICRQNPVNEIYYENVIRPLLDLPDVEYIGEINDHQKNDFIGKAKAVLFPINWPEPFGLVLIEAMACGTPVIAYSCGSVPEVLEDGVTGFIVKTPEEAIEALKKVDTLDRRAIRKEFERRFSSPIMAQKYCALYEEMSLRNSINIGMNKHDLINPENILAARNTGRYDFFKERGKRRDRPD